MRRKVLMLLCAFNLLLPSALLSKSFQGASMRVGDDPVIIVLLPDMTIPDAPRGPVFNPFTAFLQGNSVILNCSISYGDVDVKLTSSAGDFYTTVFDTADGSILIPISSLSGDYTLSLVDSAGVRFVGEFEI